MTAHRRTEITVETDRVVIIRRQRLVRAWCQECGGEVEMVSLPEAQAVTELSGSAQARWHLSEHHEGSFLVCLRSLRESM
jgi:hypothetical protein